MMLIRYLHGKFIGQLYIISINFDGKVFDFYIYSYFSGLLMKFYIKYHFYRENFKRIYSICHLRLDFRPSKVIFETTIFK